jgi:hypothetical protein
MDIESEMQKVVALCDHAPAEKHRTLLRQLLAHWTRQHNLLTKGKPSLYSLSEIQTMLQFLESSLKETSND